MNYQLIIEKHEKLNEMICEFCDQYLDDESKEICVKILDSLFLLDTHPLIRGSPEIWAAGIISIYFQINFIFNDTLEPYVSLDDVFNHFKSNKESSLNEARNIRELLDIRPEDYKYSSSYAQNNKVYLMNAIKKIYPHMHFKSGNIYSFTSNSFV